MPVLFVLTVYIRDFEGKNKNLVTGSMNFTMEFTGVSSIYAQIRNLFLIAYIVILLFNCYFVFIAFMLII